MTKEDKVYGDWLDLLGSSLEEAPVLTEALHKLHDAAEASHACICSSGSPLDYDGPQPDCPRHGDPAVLGYDPQEAR